MFLIRSGIRIRQNIRNSSGIFAREHEAQKRLRGAFIATMILVWLWRIRSKECAQALHRLKGVSGGAESAQGMHSLSRLLWQFTFGKICFLIVLRLSVQKNCGRRVRK